MSRSVAATAAGRQRSLPRTPAPHHPRRVSGPARPAARTARPPRARVDARALAAPRAAAHPRPLRLPALPQLRVVAGGAAFASRVAGVALDVSGSRTMDRLVRSRVWIGIVAFGLIGIVAMQVSMLKLNAGIGRAVETVNTLERTNSSLRGEVSQLRSGDRIRSLAGARGFVMPAPADVTYLRAGDLRDDGARAARNMHAPDLAIAGPAGAATAPAGLPTAPGLVAPASQTGPAVQTAPLGQVAPAGQTVPAGQPAAPAPVAAAPATSTPAGAAPATAPPSSGGAPAVASPVAAPAATAATATGAALPTAAATVP
jgi:cell division protein FtsB